MVALAFVRDTRDTDWSKYLIQIEDSNIPDASDCVKVYGFDTFDASVLTIRMQQVEESVVPLPPTIIFLLAPPKCILNRSTAATITPL